MHAMTRWWLDEIDRNPVMAGVLLVWGINATMNGAMGYTTGGEGLWGVMLGLVFVAIAALGSYAASQQAVSRGMVRACLWAMVAFQLCLGQIAGWQSLGLTLSRGAAGLETQATQRDSAKAQLARARAERESIGLVRPVAAIQADAVLECEKKSSRYRDGVGPKCTAFRAELATADRARKLDASIPGLLEALAEAPTVGAANAATRVPEAFASAIATRWTGKPVVVDGDAIRFGLQVFLVAVLEFIATLGPWLFASGPARGDQPGHGYGGGHGAGGGGGAGGPRGGNSMQDVMRQVMAGATPAWAGPGLPAPAERLQLAGPAGSSSINLYLGHGGTSPGLPASSPLIPSSARPDFLLEVDGKIVEQRPARGPRQDLDALPADGPPVDRSKIARELSPAERESADVILAFRAACVVDAPGGMVDGAHLYKRYCHWAGARALGEEAFRRLISELTGIETLDLGGLAHFRGIALRAAPALAAVA